MQAWDILRRPIWLFDPVDMRIVYANAAALALWDAPDLASLMARDFTRPSPAVFARNERLKRVTADGAALSEHWVLYPNGDPVTVSTMVSTYHMDDGTPVLLIEACPIDIAHDERRAVEALHHTSTLITLFDHQAQPVFCNPAAYAAYGSDTHAFEARFVQPEAAQPLLAQALGGVIANALCETVTRQGVRWHHLDARPVTDPVTGLVGVLLNERDMTERVEAEQARAAAEQKAAMAEARQKFLTEMSHELRTQLNAVIGFSDLMGGSNLPAEQADHVARINAAGHRLRRVVDEMIGLSAARPDAAPDVAAAPAAAHAPPAGADTAGAVKVLYVDDNDSNRALVVAVLAAHGMVCATAEDGAQGVDVARHGGWDLILMDIQMPIMDGVSAARAIRALPGLVGQTPILALTANTLPEQVREYAAAGMDDCVAKPIDIVDLLTRVVAWAESGWRHAPPRAGQTATAA